MTDRKYKNPPIHEAVCQMVFESPQPWSVRTAGTLYELLKGSYPLEPVEQQLIQADLVGAGPVGENASPLRVVHGPPRFQFRSNDQTQMLTVGPDLLAVHRLAPYVSFEDEFLPRVQRDIEALRSEFSALGGLKSLSLRYINKVVVPGRVINLNDYFSYKAFAAIDEMPFAGGVSGFFYRTQLANPEERMHFSLTVASVDSAEDAVGVLLDLDLVSMISENLGSEVAIVEELKRLKSKENELFESLITQKCRELFE
ncbi:TIGR04255 family protein [Actinoplanes sp. GCM10030250]|uniref:TIGR04255 family protein n=1 Tax=Actinoplanes sp. GCM10030250 TaxID=3273376 RepID=UPI00361743AE